MRSEGLNQVRKLRDLRELRKSRREFNSEFRIPLTPHSSLLTPLHAGSAICAFFYVAGLFATPE
ncbi:MAG: hypothetical protein N4J56_001366 [Chroococcidiopsis sp. SAG 2025]|nr:hypothetical protein [Chroococcidiopsis sp. SAG 2025]